MNRRDSKELDFRYTGTEDSSKRRTFYQLEESILSNAKKHEYFPYPHNTISPKNYRVKKESGGIWEGVKRLFGFGNKQKILTLEASGKI